MFGVAELVSGPVDCFGLAYLWRPCLPLLMFSLNPVEQIQMSVGVMDRRTEARNSLHLFHLALEVSEGVVILLGDSYYTDRH